ncbi:MAG: baseplate J/gp47 family protein [Candidatus Hodarchaeota archaeon]
MSFVAEPYAEIVDNLLTSLTGGTVYEEHVFDPAVTAYSLANPPAQLDTIKVSGSLDQEFHVFVPDQDFEPQMNEIVWLEGEGVNRPDEGTRFFVNYYPLADEFRPLLSDRNVGSVTRLFGESFGREFTLLSKRLAQVYLSGFVDTAEGRALEQVVAILGVERKSAQFAVGNITFLRDTPSPADIFVPQGLQVSTDIEPIVTYETTAQRLLQKGQLSVTVPIRATVKGEEGLVDANRITVMNRPILGIDRVTNPNNATFGTEPESDAQLRKRAKSQLERAGKTTLNALKFALLAIRAQSGNKISQLRENDIKIEEDFTQGPGLVRILLDADEGNPALVREVNRAIFETRAAGIAVVHNLKMPTGEGRTGEGSDEASEAALAARAELAASEATAAGAGEEEMEKPIVDLKKIEVQIRMTASLIDMSLTEEEKGKILLAVQDAVSAYFEALAIGQKVVINRLINTVLNVEGVQDIVRLQWAAKLPTGDVLNGTRFDIHLPPDQKAVLSSEPNAIEIKLAGSPVRMDFNIDATIAGDSNLPQSKVENEIELKLATFFDTLTGNLKLTQLELALAGNEYEVSEIRVNVEYAETGLIIRDAQKQGPEIAIGENEIAVIGIVRISIKGGVEGA